MNTEEKKEYLEGYRRAQERIVSLTNELERWQTIGEKANSVIGIGGGSHSNSSKVEKAAVNVGDIVSDIQREINAARLQRESIKNTIEKCCKRMRYTELLTMRYINGMSNRKIAKLQHKEEKTISNMINTAIKELNI